MMKSMYGTSFEWQEHKGGDYGGAVFSPRRGLSGSGNCSLGSNRTGCVGNAIVRVLKIVAEDTLVGAGPCCSDRGFTAPGLCREVLFGGTGKNCLSQGQHWDLQPGLKCPGCPDATQRVSFISSDALSSNFIEEICIF